jgi:hypothetical protein
MRKIMLTAAAALVSAALLPAPHAGAMMLSSTNAIRSAAGATQSIENVVCYGNGWRGPGIYPGWFRPACNPWTQAYVAVPEYVPAAPVYAAPTYPGPRRCWVRTAPDNNSGYWAQC